MKIIEKQVEEQSEKNRIKVMCDCKGCGCAERGNPCILYIENGFLSRYPSCPIANERHANWVIQ